MTRPLAFLTAILAGTPAGLDWLTGDPIDEETPA